MMRQCGDCTLCCKLLPVPPLGKKANERCKHQRHTGCRVYNKRDPLIAMVAGEFSRGVDVTASMPPECQLWNCRWLVDKAGKTSRPDRSHIVIDIVPDFISAVPHDGGPMSHIEVIQCWVDPKYPDAHRDPAFRDYILQEAQNGKAALIRYSDREAFTLLAPILNSQNEWLEIHGGSISRTHSFLEIAQALGGLPNG